MTTTVTIATKIMYKYDSHRVITNANMLLIVLPLRLKLFAKLPGINPDFGSARPQRMTRARSVGSLKPSRSDMEVSMRTLLPKSLKLSTKVGSELFIDWY